MNEQTTTVTETVTEQTETDSIITSIEFLLDSSEITTLTETISETTTVSDSTAEDAVLQSVQNIEMLLMYIFGILLILIVVYLCNVIIKTFFR